MIEAIIFDLDHTLADWGNLYTYESWIENVANPVLKKEIGVTLSYEEWRKGSP